MQPLAKGEILLYYSPAVMQKYADQPDKWLPLIIAFSNVYLRTREMLKVSVCR